MISYVVALLLKMRINQEELESFTTVLIKTRITRTIMFTTNYGVHRYSPGGGSKSFKGLKIETGLPSKFKFLRGVLTLFPTAR